MAESTSWLVFIAVCPLNPATRLLLSASTSCPLDSTPRVLSTLAIILATVVFPVPGLPVNM